MKKLLFLMSAGLAMMASCTNEEVTDIADSRAIGFDAFVNNSTKALVENTTDNFAKFWVFGSYENTTNNWVPLLSNVEVTRSGNGSPYTWTSASTAYWQTNKAHNFAAYADGASKLDGASYDAANNTLTFTNYTTTGLNDLVASYKKVASTDVSSANPVSFTFKHMLSKIKFTFKTNMAENYIMEVSNLKFNAVNKATGTLKDKTNSASTSTGNTLEAEISWTATGDNTTGDYTYNPSDENASATPDSYITIDDFATAEMQKETSARFVIPQSNENLKASFTVTVYINEKKEENKIATKEFTDISLAYTPATENGKGTANTWTHGFVYNYIATIDLKDVDDKAKPIEFAVTAVEDWTEANEQNPYPNTPNPLP